MNSSIRTLAYTINTPPSRHSLYTGHGHACQQSLPYILTPMTPHPSNYGYVPMVKCCTPTTQIVHRNSWPTGIFIFPAAGHVRRPVHGHPAIMAIRLDGYRQARATGGGWLARLELQPLFVWRWPVGPVRPYCRGRRRPNQRATGQVKSPEQPTPSCGRCSNVLLILRPSLLRA